MKILLTLCCTFMLTQILHAQPSKAALKLAKETETYCATTASTKATPQMIVKKVKAAAALLEKDGKKAFSAFSGKDSKFIFAGTYIWINDFNGVMLMHPIKPGMVNKNLIGLKDSNGKRFFVDMIAVCRAKGSGWVDYLWPKPGEKERSLKVSYVHKATCDGEDIVVGCGVYDMTLEEIEKSFKE